MNLFLRNCGGLQQTTNLFRSSCRTYTSRNFGISFHPPLKTSRSSLIRWSLSAFNFITNANYSTNSPPPLPPEKRSILRQLFRSPDGTFHYFPAFSSPIESVLVRSIFPDRNIARLIAKSASFAIYSFVAVSALGTLGVDTNPIITGLGITGFTIGFALKDIATNFLSGLMLMTQKPFKTGDKVKVADLEGTVETVDVRYVVLRNSKGRIMIPSATVYSNAVIVEEPVKSTEIKS